MISMKKRGICLILLLCTVFMTLGGYCKKANSATTFNNTIYADLVSYVDSNGKDCFNDFYDFDLSQYRMHSLPAKKMRDLNFIQKAGTIHTFKTLYY